MTISVSVDLDDLWCSVPGTWRRMSLLEEAIEEAVLLFDRHRIRATFFCIARDRRILARGIPLLEQHGHEIANHSFMHRYNQTLSRARKKRDLVVTHHVLSELSQEPPCGYRAPGWGFDAEIDELLFDMGYRYDASLVVSPLYLLLRVPHFWKQKKRTYIYGSIAENLGHTPRARLPLIKGHSVRALPFYGSFHLYAPAGRRIFQLQRRRALRKRPLTYTFHASDFIVDRRERYSIFQRPDHGEALAEILRFLSHNGTCTLAESLEGHQM